jgi:hypothetical protein
MDDPVMQPLNVVNFEALRLMEAELTENEMDKID